MAPTRENRMTLGRTADGYVVHVNGHGTMRESPTLREFGASCLDNHVDAKLTVDLSDCDYVDSTFLGCLVLLHKRGSRGAPGRFLIAAPAERRRSLLSSTRFDRFFEQVDAAPQALGEPLRIDPTAIDSHSLGRHVMECHRELAEVNGPNREEFARVAERLAEELDAHSGEG